MKPGILLFFVLGPLGLLSSQNTQDLGWSESFESNQSFCTSLIPWLVDLRSVPRRGFLEIQITRGAPGYLVLTPQNRRGQWSQTPAYLPLGNPETPNTWTLDLASLWTAMEEDPSSEFLEGGLLRVKIELWGRGDPSQGGLLTGRGLLKHLAD